MSDFDEQDMFGYPVAIAGASETEAAEKSWAAVQRAAAERNPYAVTRRPAKMQHHGGPNEVNVFGYETMIDYDADEQRDEAQEARVADEQWRQLIQSQKRQARKFTGRSPVTAPFFRQSALPMTQVYTDTIRELQAAQAAPGRPAAEVASLRAQEQVYRRELANLRAQEAAHRERMARTAMAGGKKSRQARRSQRKSIRKLVRSARKSQRRLTRSLKQSIKASQKHKK